MPIDREHALVGRKVVYRDPYKDHPEEGVVAYYCFGGFVPYPWNGSFVQNRKFTHWQPLEPLPAK